MSFRKSISVKVSQADKDFEFNKPETGVRSYVFQNLFETTRESLELGDKAR